MSLLCARVFGVYSADRLAAARDKALAGEPLRIAATSHSSGPIDLSWTRIGHSKPTGGPMSTYQNLVNQASDARAQAQTRLDELRLIVTNLRNDLSGQIGAPEGSVTIAQNKSDGTSKMVIPQSLTYTDEHTIRFLIQVKLESVRGSAVKLSVPASIVRTEASTVISVEESSPHAYQPGNNPFLINLILDSLARQAGEVGV
jgi:hypothetical protein